MAILKKIKSATLMEAIVATLIIVIIFVVASVIVNNLLQNTFAKQTHQINFRMNELEYGISNHQIILPYEEQINGWDIEIYKDTKSNAVLIMAIDEKGTSILRKRMYAN